MMTGAAAALISKTGFSLQPNNCVSLRMFLPNADQAEVTEEKLRDYLLNENHPVGAAKAQFLARFGYRIDQAPLLKEALIKLARSNPTMTLTNTPFGTNYRIDGLLANPLGRNMRVTTIWHIERNGTRPRLITLYPAR